MKLFQFVKNPLKTMLRAAVIVSIFLLTPVENRVTAQEKYNPDNFGGGWVPASEDEMASVQWSVPVVRGTLPSSVDLSEYLPPIGSQGSQGSCVGWSTTYYLKSYNEKRKKDWSYGSMNINGREVCCCGNGNHAFSPAWTYNQINNGRDRGSSIYNALTLLRDKGAVPCTDWPYNVKDYLKQPTYQQRQTALNYRIRSFAKVDVSNLTAVKSELAQGNLLVGGFRVNPALKRPSNGWVDDSSGNVTGGHAMAVVGYNDNMRSPRGHQGAFLIVNSWNTYYGVKGYCWMSYRTFVSLCKYIYVAHDYKGSDNPVDVNDDAVRAPSNVSATKGSYRDRVVVSWSRVRAASAYSLYRTTASSSSYRRIGYVYETSYDDTSVQSAMTYNYRVVAVSSSTSSRLEDSPTAEGYAVRQSDSKPGTVMGLSASGSGSSVNLAWQPVRGAQKYEIWKYNTYSRKWARLTFTAGTSTTDSSPKAGYYNYYSVRASNSAGSGPWCDSVKAMVSSRSKKQSGPPGNVSGVKATQGAYSDKIVITWSSEPQASSYTIYRYNYSKKAWDKYFKTSTNRFVDSTYEVSDGNPYVYTVKAYNSYGESQNWSSPYAAGYAGIKVMSGGDTPPEAPKLKLVRLNDRSGQLSFKWGKVKGARSYVVYRKKEKTKFKMLKTLSGKETGFSDTAPESDTLYFYSVRAKSKSGKESKDSNLITGFKNEPVVMSMQKIDPAEGLKKFVGSWEATDLAPSGKSVPVKVQVTSRKDIFTAVVTYGAKKMRFSGAYAAESSSINASDFSFTLLKLFDNDVGKAKFTLAGKKVLSINMERQK